MGDPMGIETAILIGGSIFKAVQSIKTANDQAEAQVEEGEIAAENKRKEVRQKAARQQLSFLNSGLTLDGTPRAVIQGTFDTGLEDINQILNNTDTRAKNTVKAGRSEAIGNLVSGATSAGFGAGSFSGSDVFGSQGVASRAIEFGSFNAQGPIQGFGGFGG
jgi:hypothetical protein